MSDIIFGECGSGRPMFIPSSIREDVTTWLTAGEHVIAYSDQNDIWAEIKNSWNGNMQVVNGNRSVISSDELEMAFSVASKMNLKSVILIIDIILSDFEMRALEGQRIALAWQKLSGGSVKIARMPRIDYKE